MSASSAEWDRVKGATRELAAQIGPDMVLIGGVAVHLHTLQMNRASVRPEATHDVDIAIDLPALSTLSDYYEVVVNRRLGKRQVTVQGIEIDLYPAYQSSLRIDYSDLATHSETILGLRVAALEHLLVLKLDAYRDRRASEAGRKDRRDIARLLIMLEGFDPTVTLALIGDADRAAIRQVLESTVFLDMAPKRNAATAKKLRLSAEFFADRLGPPRRRRR